MNFFVEFIALVPKSQLFHVAGLDSVSNWTASGEWVKMELGTVLSLLSKRHKLILLSLVLWVCSGRTLD